MDDDAVRAAALTAAAQISMDAREALHLCETVFIPYIKGQLAQDPVIVRSGGQEPIPEQTEEERQAQLKRTQEAAQASRDRRKAEKVARAEATGDLE